MNKSANFQMKNLFSLFLSWDVQLKEFVSVLAPELCQSFDLVCTATSVFPFKHRLFYHSCAMYLVLKINVTAFLLALSLSLLLCVALIFFSFLDRRKRVCCSSHVLTLWWVSSCWGELRPYSGSWGPLCLSWVSSSRRCHTKSSRWSRKHHHI